TQVQAASGAHTRRGTGRDDVARFERDDLAGGGDQPGDGTDHVGGRFVLLKLAVHPQAYPQVLGVGDLERRRDARSEGERAVDGLRGEPVVDESVRRYRLPLVVAAGGDVVGDAVSGDV